MNDILDLFCSNGSTWIDKTFFKNKVLKNDIRKGIYQKISSNPQVLHIDPDYQVDLLNQIITGNELPVVDIVYADPPHIINATGFMFETYGTLFDNWSWQLDNLVENCNKVCNKLLILKWNDRSISIKTIIKKFEKYFIPGIQMINQKIHNNSHVVIFIKKTTHGDAL